VPATEESPSEEWEEVRLENEHSQTEDWVKLCQILRKFRQKSGRKLGWRMSTVRLKTGLSCVKY
jgi:hypothetical protein